MRSKISCCNKTVFRKNLTRFAPVWGVYTLCLVVGVLLLYSNGGTVKHFHFARNMTRLVEIMAVVNLVYAPLVAQLLFGDLYSSRMCNMLHAFPLRRENWYFTNLLSGAAFSLVPTAVMALVSLPLLAGSIFQGAVSLSWWIFLASNLQFMCFFGMAAFCVMVVGNRFTMAAAYGLLNAGAAIAYWLIDTIYTPMLYGIITPTQLMNRLTPMYHMTNVSYIQISSELYQLRELFGEELKGAVATFTITDNWWRLWMLAGVGLSFAVLGLLLYRVRDLECAGSAVAFPVLRPVFQILCAIFVSAAGQFFLYNFVGMNQRNFLILTVGLVVGWFIGKMLTEHTSRVFYLKNFCGLAILAAVFAVSLWLTHVDLFHIETRLPDAQKICKVSFYGKEYTEPEDIDNFLALHAAALEQRAENSGTHIFLDGEWVSWYDIKTEEHDRDNPANRYTYVDSVSLVYEMDNGKLIKRKYYIWVNNDEVQSEAGRIAEEYLTRWETVNSRMITVDGVERNRLDVVLENVENIYVDYMEEGSTRDLATPANVRMLISALKADCAEGNMAQSYFYHTGSFRIEDEYAENGYRDVPEISISISDGRYTWWINVYPDSVNTLRWLEANDLLNMEVRPENIVW